MYCTKKPRGLTNERTPHRRRMGVVMRRVPEEGFPSSHLLMNITKGKPYQVVEKYMRSVAVIDDATTRCSSNESI